MQLQKGTLRNTICVGYNIKKSWQCFSCSESRLIVTQCIEVWSQELESCFQPRWLVLVRAYVHHFRYSCGLLSEHKEQWSSSHCEEVDVSFFCGSLEVPHLQILDILASFPGLPIVQFLIACSMQKWRGKVWSVNDISVYLGRQREGGVPHRKGRTWCLILLFLSQVLEFQTFMKWKMYHSWFKMKNTCAKCVLSISN